MPGAALGAEQARDFLVSTTDGDGEPGYEHTMAEPGRRSFYSVFHPRVGSGGVGFGCEARGGSWEGGSLGDGALELLEGVAFPFL